MAGASILLASLAALAYWVLSKRPCESQIATVESLRALNYAQMEYEQTHPDSGYAPTLAELRAETLIDEILATGTAHEYEFALTSGARESSGRILTYTVLAEPSFHFARCPSLFTDETGVIRFTRERRQATATDPPLQ
jgi:hypothetical protein